MKKILFLGLAAALIAAGPYPAAASGASAETSLDTDSSAPSEAGRSLEEAAGGDIDETMDGSRQGSGASVEAGSGAAVPKPSSRGSLRRATFKSVPASASAAGGKKEPGAVGGTWEKMKPWFTVATQVAAVGGLVAFMFGVFSLSLPLMMGGALLAAAGVALGGIIQSGILEAPFAKE